MDEKKSHRVRVELTVENPVNKKQAGPFPMRGTSIGECIQLMNHNMDATGIPGGRVCDVVVIEEA